MRLAQVLAGSVHAGAPPGPGAVVSPDPIRPRIRRSGLAAGLADFCRPPPTSDARPRALLNHLYHAGDGSGRLFANDSRGVLWAIDGATGAATLSLDLREVRRGAFLAEGPQMGLRSFAFHPDHASPGRPGHRKLYTVSTEAAGSRPGGTPVFEGPFAALFDDVVAEWSLAGDGHVPRADPESRREVLRVAQPKRDHNTDQLAFDPHARPGDPGYGMLFAGVGDGGNAPERPDPHDQAQDAGRALGKILRVDPLRQADGAAYGIPADNPFVGRPGHLPEVWALGLRHPQNLSFDQGGTGAFLLTDIGQRHVEEVNLGVAGANYGWPLREGTFATDRRDPATLRALPPDDAALGFTYPVAQYDRDEAGGGKMAVAGGFVYRGAAVPALAGEYLFGDIVSGRVFHVPVRDLRPGVQTTIKELALFEGGRPAALQELVGRRVDLRFGQDEAGEVYLLTKQDGAIRKLVAT
jgi:glucose/arabinose dehydrogenase